MKSSINSAVVLGSTVTGFSVGAAGALMLAHSSTMLFAWAGSVSVAITATVAIRLRFMNILPRWPAFLTNACGPDHAQAKRVRQSGNAVPRLLKHGCSAQYCEDTNSNFDAAKKRKNRKELLHEYQGRQASDRRSYPKAQELGTLGQRGPDRHAQPRDA